MPEEPWTEICNIVQEPVIKTIPKKKKCKKAKWLSEEVLQIAEKRREAKGKGEKQRYTHLNAEFQRIVRRDKKAFLRDQCKEIEENNKMGKTSDLFKKIRYQGNISCKDRHNKEEKQYVSVLTEAHDIKRWQEYMKTLFKKGLNNPDKHDGMITHLEPDILKCEVQWALGNMITNKVSGADRIPVELFQVLKDDAVKVLHSICQQIWKTQQWPWDWKRSASFQSQRKAMPMNIQTTAQLHSSHKLAR